MSLTKIKLNAFANDIRLGSFRVEAIEQCSHWLVQQILFPPKDEKLFSLTDTDQAITLLIEGNRLKQIPKAITLSKEVYSAIKIVAGDLGFEMAGIVNAIAAPLAEAGVPLMYVSTFSTDLFLVAEDHLKLARETLEKQAFEFVDKIDNKKELQRKDELDNALQTTNKSFQTPKTASQRRVVLSKLPFELRMGRIRGDFSRFARGLVRICLYPQYADRFFSMTRLDDEVSLIFEEEERKLAFGTLFDHCHQSIDHHSHDDDDDDNNDEDETKSKSTVAPSVNPCPECSVCDACLSPDGWSCFIMSTLASGYNEAGVMAKFTTPLAENNVSIFKVTTTTNDYSLIADDSVERAVTTLTNVFDVEVVDEERVI